MAKPFNVAIDFRANTSARGELLDRAARAVQETFEIDVKKRAIELSPVRKVKFKSKGRWFPGGTNRRSIDTDVKKTATGVFARLFTQSGYGGYLELGTRYMRARPYLFPAFIENIPKLYERLKKYVGGK